jgi:hypothetical protein
MIKRRNSAELKAIAFHLADIIQTEADKFQTKGISRQAAINHAIRAMAWPEMN